MKVPGHKATGQEKEGEEKELTRQRLKLRLKDPKVFVAESYKKG